MQTVGSLLSGCLKDKNGVPVIPKDRLKQLVKEQFPHCEKKEIRAGVYEIKIPLTGSRLKMPMSSFQVGERDLISVVFKALGADDIIFLINDELDQLLEQQFPHSEKENKPSALSGADSLSEEQVCMPCSGLLKECQVLMSCLDHGDDQNQPCGDRREPLHMVFKDPKNLQSLREGPPLFRLDPALFPNYPGLRDQGIQGSCLLHQTRKDGLYGDPVSVHVTDQRVL
ncbi:UNVERIFIED_CONTAM: hypothetical protein K2H54_022198 [Gekko kuhli]